MQCVLHAGKISHDEVFVVNIIDKDVTHRTCVVDAQVYLHRAVGSNEVSCLHHVFNAGLV